jgi:type II secretory pathway component PulF
MTVWRYTAVPLDGRGSPSSLSQGEMAGETAADVRASLRRIGLQVVKLRAARSHQLTHLAAPASILQTAGSRCRAAMDRHLRRRRAAARADFYDSLATLLESGLPLLEALQTMNESRSGKRSTRSHLLVDVRDSLRAGSSLSHALDRHRGWFDPTEVAMIAAAQQSGTLPGVLRRLSERQHRSLELTQKLIASLTYPLIISMVGLGVVVFLSVKTLPQLAQLLTDGGVAVPALTRAVIAFGSFLVGRWLTIACVLLLVLIAASVLRAVVGRGAYAVSKRAARWLPMHGFKVTRRIAVADLALRLSELSRCGVPLVDAIRITAPTVRSPILRVHLERACDRLQRGDELSAAFDDERWFDSEFRHLLDIGQTSGELDSLLERIGQRYERQARRLIDRLAALLEPAVILLLALLVGLVVMAAILPLARLQEIVR